MMKPAKTNNPTISVVMPVYNADKFLREAIDSILRQTFSDFELIIINDGSTDSSAEIISEYTKIDNRIISLSQKNHGVVYTANRGIRAARGEYIARMDADDVSLPNRLHEEIAILKKHKDVILVCSSFEVFDDMGEFCYKEIVPPNDIDIKHALYLRNPIANGSTLIRKSALEDAGLFDDIFAEDFHMWTKLSQMGKFMSTGTVQYRWRMNPDGLTLANNALSMDHGKQYVNSLWEKHPPSPSSRRQLQRRVSTYYKTQPERAVYYEKVLLSDASQFAAKLFTRRHFIIGLRQLGAVSMTSRQGFLISVTRIRLVLSGLINRPKKAITPLNDSDSLSE